MADIVARAKALVLHPAEEWALIAVEPADTRGLILGYAAPLALIPAIAGLIGRGLIRGRFGVPVSFFSLLLHAIVAYILGLVGIWVVGKLIQLLAPRFGGTDDEVSAMKLAVYSPTPSWLAGIFLLIPFLGILSLLGLYSLYLFYLGAPVTKVPQARALPFTAAVIVCAMVLFILVGWIAAVL